MSASQPETAIFMTDPVEEVERKILNAFDGGQPTLREQKKRGGNPDICPIYHYFYFLFEPDDKKIRSIRTDCQDGELMCGECKQKLAQCVVRFVSAHQKKREKVRDVIDRLMLRD
jgi:tryptophanyl-tRNA synthetase